jgi:hypothetical protein
MDGVTSTEKRRRWRLSVASALVASTFVSGCQTPSERKTEARLLGDTMLARVGDVVRSETVRGRGSADPDRPYRRATVLHDARVSCVERREPDASCGAVVEIFRKERKAADRVRADNDGGLVVRRGVYVLRVSPELDLQTARVYRAAFLETLRARGEG